MKILIIQTAYIGDCVLTTPLVQRVHDDLISSGDRLELLSTPQGGEVFANNPYLDDILLYDKRNSERAIGSFFGLARRLLERNYDIAILPHRSFRSGLISRMARISRRIGFAEAAGKAFYTDKIDRNMNIHEAERMLELLEPFGVEAKPCPTRVYPNDDQSAKAIDFLKSNGIEKTARILAIAPGTVWATKRYPPEKYAEVARELLNIDLFDNVILIAGPSDRGICDVILNMTDSRVVSASGCGDILFSAALIRECGLLIGNDSGPGHVAAAVDTPVISIFGPTVPRFGFTPYGVDSRIIEPPISLNCRPCGLHGKKSCPRKDHACMQSIEPAKIVDAALEIVDDRSVGS